MPDNITTQTVSVYLRASAERDRALADAATPGEWSSEIDPHSDSCNPYCYYICVDGRFSIDEEGSYQVHDAEFIAASRSIVPRQAEQIRVLVEALEEIAAEEPPSYVADEIAEAALDAAWALEEES